MKADSASHKKAQASSTVVRSNSDVESEHRAEKVRAECRLAAAAATDPSATATPLPKRVRRPPDESSVHEPASETTTEAAPAPRKRAKTTPTASPSGSPNAPVTPPVPSTESIARALLSLAPNQPLASPDARAEELEEKIRIARQQVMRRIARIE